MKIRIKSNSVRYRLTRTDIAQLTETGFLKDKVDFGNQQLIYALQITNDDNLSASFINNTITVQMPKNMIDEMANTDRVGFENHGETLHLLIEKDFICLDNVAEDQSDNYPNPLAEKLYEKGN
jgi:hypothetical protein